MSTQLLVHPDDIRTLFSRAMSDLYRTEVPLYGTLLQLVSDVNHAVLTADAALADGLRDERQLSRLDVERHGAIRLGTAQELQTMRRLFAVMGLQPVGYYDLSVAGVPVHSTAFRPTDDEALGCNPFRVFTSLLRLELIADEGLRQQAAAVLAKRQIFTSRCLELIELSEQQKGLTETQARQFVEQALETFRWHSQATVDFPTYKALREAHTLVADIVCFKGPHINHLTPRTLDIDAVQEGMSRHGMQAKNTIEGPPRRQFPILLRQTSFLALEESIQFLHQASTGSHSARFGEVEQRGCALTRKGRALYDALLGRALEASRSGVPMALALEKTFHAFPDDAVTLHNEQLAFFRYKVNGKRLALQSAAADATTSQLVDGGWLSIEPITYEDFLPVSAAGIFRSNLGNEVRDSYAAQGNQASFEAALGARVLDEIALYEQVQSASLAECLEQIRRQVAEVPV